MKNLYIQILRVVKNNLYLCTENRNILVMNNDEELRAKLVEVSEFAIQHITGNGMQTDYHWLQDSFNEYYKMISSPGARISEEAEIAHREILAQKVAIECIHALSKEQLQNLDKVLNNIATDLNTYHGLYR